VALIFKSTGIAERSHGEFMLRLVLMVTLPLLILSTLSTTPITLNKAMLPVANIAVSFACMLITLIVIKLFTVERKQAGSMLVSTMILNNTYMFPFILVVYGSQAFADAILFDFGNALLMSSYVYILALKYGGEEHSGLDMLVKLAKSPMIWSIIISLVLAISGIRLPDMAFNFIDPLAQMTAPLILITLGIFFSIKIQHFKLVGLTVFIRMGMGLLFGIAVGSYLGLSETTLIVVALCSGAPVGFMALTFSSLANLDTDLSSSAVSISILSGLIYFPLIMLYFGVP